MNYNPAYPNQPFAILTDAHAWVARFVRWSNEEHRPSAIRFVTPGQRHHGEEIAILANRYRAYEAAQRSNPKRWSRDIRNWASIKRVRPKDGSGSGPGPGRNSERDFHGEKRSNDTHASQTDLEARLYRKSRGQGERLCYQSHILMENHNGLIVDDELTPASGTGERTAAVEMFGEPPRDGGRRSGL